MRLFLLLSLALAACSQKAAPPPPRPAEVGVMTLRQQPVTIVTELPGRTVSYRVAEVRPQVNGVILKRLYTEGSQVKAGQQLYQIDPAPFQASYESAQAALARAQATATSTRLLAQRYKPLSEARAVSQQDYDNAVASQDQAAADVASAKAALDTARINLAYTKVFAPITGRTGRSSVTEGALVAANQTAAMVVIQQLDPIYVDATQASTVLLRLQRALADGQLKKVGEGQAEAKLILEDGTPYSPNGKLQFSEVTVDSGTGSVSLRAVFPNPKNILLPGMFVREQLGRRRERDRPARAAAGGRAQSARRSHRDGGGRGQQDHHASHQNGSRHRRSMAGQRRRRRGRPGHRDRHLGRTPGRRSSRPRSHGR